MCVSAQEDKIEKKEVVKKTELSQYQFKKNWILLKR
jgi:hypothetical protein